MYACMHIVRPSVAFSLPQPNVIAVHEMFDTEEALYIVLELYVVAVAIAVISCLFSPLMVACGFSRIALIVCSASGGELFDRIIDKRKFSEPETKFFFRQLFLAVKYLHEHGVVHRDLKVTWL